jgi:hypothetical protein
MYTATKNISEKESPRIFKLEGCQHKQKIKYTNLIFLTVYPKENCYGLDARGSELEDLGVELRRIRAESYSTRGATVPAGTVHV